MTETIRSNASCPRCGSSLADRPFGSVTLDGCAHCGGVWFDPDEMNKLAREGAANLMEAESAFQDAAGAQDGRGMMACPRCGTGLYAFSYPHTPEVELDACRQCKGVWLDNGEIQKIVQRMQAAQPAVQPVSTSPVGLNLVDAGRQQLRSAAAFMLTKPCPHCVERNPASAQLCWACGKPMQPYGALSLCPRCDCMMSEFKPDTAPMSLDTCLNCKGLWFAGGELSTFLRFGLDEIKSVRHRIGRAFIQFGDLRAFETEMLSCPSCHICMAKEPVGASSTVLIDVCPRCKGVWMETDELVAAHEAYQHGDATDAPGVPDPWRM